MRYYTEILWSSSISFFFYIYTCISRETGLVSFTSLMVCANNRVYYDPMIVFVCLHITQPHYHHYADLDGILPKGPYPPCLRMTDRGLLAGYPRPIWRYWTSKMFARYNISCVCVCVCKITSISSIVFHAIYGPICIQVTHYFSHVIVRMCVYFILLPSPDQKYDSFVIV